MIMKILILIISINALIILAAFSSYISGILKNVFVEPIYALASVGVIILSLIVITMVGRNA